MIILNFHTMRVIFQNSLHFIRNEEKSLSAHNMYLHSTITRDGCIASRSLSVKLQLHGGHFRV